MAIYRYLARNARGIKVTGRIEAADKAEAIDLLRQKGLVIISFEEVRRRFVAARLSLLRGKANLDDIVIFSRMLATMIGAGVPLVSTLDILGQQAEKRSFREVILEVRESVNSGSSFSEAMSRHSDVFSPFFISMIKAGESSGTLDEIMDRVAVYFEKTSALQKKIKSAMMYPIVIFVIAIAAAFFLVWKIMPVFEQIYSAFGSKLPAPTRAFIAVSKFLQQNILLIAIAAAAAAFLVKKYIDTADGRARFDAFLLRLPVFGLLFKKVAISKFTRTLSTLVKSGIPILTTLEIVADTAGNMVIARAIDAVREKVREGENIGENLSKNEIFPPLVSRMIAIGEHSGELEKMSSKIADFYEQQVETAINGLASLLEPVMLLFLGVVVGTIVICMFMPLFNLPTLIGG